MTEISLDMLGLYSSVLCCGSSLQPIERLGQAGQIVKVAPGFARNCLMPNKLALPAIEKFVLLVQNQLKVNQSQFSRFANCLYPSHLCFFGLHHRLCRLKLGTGFTTLQLRMNKFHEEMCYTFTCLYMNAWVGNLCICSNCRVII